MNKPKIQPNKNYILANTSATDWTTIQNGNEYKPASLATENFIHCSLPRQLAFVANNYFRGEHIILFVIDPDLVTSPIKYEEGPHQDLFPHIYGPLNLNAIIHTFEMRPKADGSYEVPQELLPLI